MDQRHIVAQYWSVFRSSMLLQYAVISPLLMFPLLFILVNYLIRKGLPFDHVDTIKFFAPLILIGFFLSLLSCYFSISNYLKAKLDEPPFTGSFKAFCKSNVEGQWNKGHGRIIILPITGKQSVFFACVMFILFFIISGITTHNF